MPHVLRTTGGARFSQSNSKSATQNDTTHMGPLRSVRQLHANMGEVFLTDNNPLKHVPHLSDITALNFRITLNFTCPKHRNPCKGQI